MWETVAMYSIYKFWNLPWTSRKLRSCSGARIYRYSNGNAAYLVLQQVRHSLFLKEKPVASGTSCSGTHLCGNRCANTWMRFLNLSIF